MVFHASLRPALLSVLYRTSPSFRSCLAFSLTWENRYEEVDHGICRIINNNYECSFTQSYLVGVDKEQDEEDELRQQDDQQNDEELMKSVKRLNYLTVLKTAADMTGDVVHSRSAAGTCSP